MKYFFQFRKLKRDFYLESYSHCYSKAIVQWDSLKKLPWKISQNSPETDLPVSFLSEAPILQLDYKSSPTQMFPSDIYKVF